MEENFRSYWLVRLPGIIWICKQGLLNSDLHLLNPEWLLMGRFSSFCGFMKKREDSLRQTPRSENPADRHPADLAERMKSTGCVTAQTGRLWLSFSDTCGSGWDRTLPHSIPIIPPPASMGLFWITKTLRTVLWQKDCSKRVVNGRPSFTSGSLARSNHSSNFIFLLYILFLLDGSGHPSLFLLKIRSGWQSLFNWYGRRSRDRESAWLCPSRHNHTTSAVGKAEKKGTECRSPGLRSAKAACSWNENTNSEKSRRKEVWKGNQSSSFTTKSIRITWQKNKKRFLSFVRHKR